MSLAPRGVVLAATLCAGLAGCFAHTGGVVIEPEMRLDTPWLAGAYVETGQSDVQPLRESRVTRVGEGLYRFESTGGDWPKLYQRAFRAMLGHCPADIEDGLDALIEETGEDGDDVRETIKMACAGDLDTLCEDDFFAGSGETCQRMMARLRGETVEPPLTLQGEATIEAYRWAGEGLPHRDELLFATLPLDEAGADDWAIGEIKSIGSRGAYAGIAIFRRPLATGDLVLLQNLAPSEDNPAGGVEVWATAGCWEPDLDEDADAPVDAALDLLTSCARRLARDVTAPEGGVPTHSETFQRVAD